MRIRGRLVAVSLVSAGTAAAAFIGYQRFGRERCLRWGATDEEAAAALPGDDLLVAPDILSTRAITIDAPAAAAWPWLMQFGPGVAVPTRTTGSRTSLGLDIHSTDRILPEFQHLEVGDAFSLGTERSGRPGGFGRPGAFGGLPPRRRPVGVVVHARRERTAEPVC